MKFLVAVVVIAVIAILIFSFATHGITITKAPTSSTTITFNPSNGLSYAGDIEYTSNTVLTNDVATTGRIVIDGLATLTTNGHSLITSGSFVNYGVIYAGAPGNSAALGAKGQNYSNSYGGAGGSGGGGNGDGGGNGATPAAPTVTYAQIQSWYNNGTINYLTGAGGGGACPYNSSAGAGGDTLAHGGALPTPNGFVPCGSAGGTRGASGSYGVYIQANSINAGIIYANGQQAFPGALDIAQAPKSGGLTANSISAPIAAVVCSIYSALHSVIFLIALVLMILGAVFYAMSHVLGGQMKTNLHNYGVGIIIGGIAGLIIAEIAPYLLSTIVGQPILQICNSQQVPAWNLDSGGGGGGGVIVLAYGNGGYIQGTYNVNGGAAQGNGGKGGDGQVLIYAYGSTPPVTHP